MGPESSKQWYMEAVDQDKVVPKSKQESDARMGSILNVRDKYKENASKLEQDIATTQSAKHRKESVNSSFMLIEKILLFLHFLVKYRYGK